MMVMSAVYVIFNSNAFQNWLTGKLGNYLSAQFKTNISIGHINYVPLQTFQLEHVLFGDHKNDTLFYAGKIDFKLAGFKLDSSIFKLSDVKVDEGYCHIKFYKDNTFNIDVLFNILDPNDTLPSVGPPFTLYFDKVKFTNSRFRFVNETDTTKWKNFAANDEYFYNINASTNQFYIIKDSLHFNLTHLDLQEKSGFKAKHIQSIVTVSPSCLFFDSLTLKTPFTTAYGAYQMRYKDWGSFSNFFDDVYMNIDLKPSLVDAKDVAFFAEPFESFPIRLSVKGVGKGTVSKLDLRQLDVRFGKGGIFKGKAKLNGLPNIDNTFIDAEVKQLVATKSDIEYLAHMPLSNELNKLGVIKFNGQYTGFYKDFVAFGKLQTALGNAETDLNMKLADNTEDYQYSGSLVLTDFDLGKLSSQSLLGKLTLNATLQGKGLSFDKIDAGTDAKVSYFDFKGYRYHNLEIVGGLANKNISATLNINDPNLKLNFEGDIDLSEDESRYNFMAKVEHANIKPLGFDTTDLTVSADADIDFAWKNLDKNRGKIEISNVIILRDDDQFEIKQILLNSAVNDGKRSLSFRSDNIKADANGYFNLLELGTTSSIVLHKLIPAYFEAPQKTTTEPQQFTFSISAQSLHPFNALYFNGIEVRNVVASGAFDQSKMDWNLKATADQFTLNNLQFRRININHTKNGNTKLLADVGRFLINDTLFARGIHLASSLGNNTAEISLKSSDTNTIFSTNTRLNLAFSPQQIEGWFNTSTINYGKSNFVIDSMSQLSYSQQGFRFKQFKLVRQGNQFVAVDGLYSLADKHDLKVDLKNIKLDVVNDLVPAFEIKTNGIVNGKASLETKNGNLVLSSDAELNQLSFDGDTVGDFRIMSNYVNQQSRLMAFVKSLNGKLRNLEIGGYYDFAHKDDALNFNINFDESDVSAVQAFVKDYIKLYSGNVRANGQLTGSLKYPEFNCNLDLMGVTLKVEYLKTMYSFSTSIKINEQQIKLAPTEIRDINDRRATLQGYISHKNFAHFKSNISLTDLKGFQLLNTKADDNDLFYGTAYADGSLSLTGPFDDLMFDAKLTAKKGTVVNIPLSTSIADADDGLIRFVNKDTTASSVDYKKSGSLSGFAIKCLMHATRDAEINIVMDEQQGDKIRGRGEGDVLLELTKTGQFNMYGEVEVNEGDYGFTAMNLFTKKFTLKPGGKITWTGDPFGGMMNITGVYNVRTTVADIVAGATADEREMLKQQRIPVECLLYVKGPLLNPDIKFDLNITDVNGSLPSSTVSELQNNLRVWRNENELMTQQVISLMLFGRFAPTNVQNATGGTNISAGVNNTLSGFVSSQATSLIQRIIPGFDLNIDYHSGNESVRGRQIVSGTKRMFDNRLEIQASFDPINTYQNFLTQYNLSRDGSFKAKAFSRAQVDPIYNRNINTNGIGLYYRREFDKFPNFLKFKK